MRTTLFGAVPLLAVLAAGVLATGASAQPKQDPPQSGDPRATAVVGNVDIGQPGNACEEVGLPGTEATMPPGTFTSDGTYIDITANPPGATVTGVVVKGGPAYNLYPVANLGPLPWPDLHPPLNSSGHPAAISHWFVCLTITPTTQPGRPTTTTTTPATTTTTTTTNATTTTSPGTTIPTTIPVTTTTAAAVPVRPDTPSADTDLANTGFDAWWLLAAALSLLAAGTAVLATPTLRNHFRR
ncbi:hypothetical protein ACIGNX_05835 [Actinosynnema sp. NPDC053489]|uniref:hypothetical protein n=1 Tax=Actinosynnema sp. NPDC053489 TaxID=3363916 RepID=UPI0037CB2432